MRVTVTVVQQGAEAQDVVVTADDSATAEDVAAALARATGGGRAADEARLGGGTVLAFPGMHEPDAGTPQLWADGVGCDPQAAAAAVLRDGMRVTVDDSIGPFMRAGEPSGRYELRVCAGPGAGRVARLGLGTATVGSGQRCTVSVPDDTLAALAAWVSVGADGRVTLAAEPDAGLALEGEPVTGERVWPTGAQVRAGSTVIVLDVPSESDAHLSPMGEGGLAYNRPPRLKSLPPRPRLYVPQPPGKSESARFQTIAALVPLVFGLAMYFMVQQVYMLLFCVMSPVMLLGQWISESREGKKRIRNTAKQFKADLAAHEITLEQARLTDRAERRAAFPDAAEILLFATGPRRRLWERRITDPDALRLRIGVADLPADIELLPLGHLPEGAPHPVPPQVNDVPVPLPLPELGVVGVAGPRGRALATARWLVAQAAVLHSPRDLSMVLLSSEPDAAQAWGWAHWLPHLAPQQGQDCVALVGTDGEATAHRVTELLQELDRRKADALAASGGGRMRPDPYVLVVLDGARLLRRTPGVPQLLQEGPRFGIYALCLDQDERLLPEEVRAAVCWAPQDGSRVHLRGAGLEVLGDVLADQVGVDWCHLVARSLAPVRDVSRDDADSALPTSARLLDLLGMPDPTGQDVAAVWQRGGSSTAAPIGVGADGTFVLDIRRDGPHALVAGTTGAGKSELLQTVITSLAVVNRPDALNFVLIDYKGGSAFQDCARLPHTVGMVSDLDAHLTERALASLAAELHHRETILFAAGTKDIEDYNDARRLRTELEPMPRLVLIIDEFASLVAELPDFVAGLVDIARRGRSLGVHLVLATQRPAGVVSADIRANTNLRIALRVTDADESRDVIDAPDSGAIAKSTPGRAYVRSGAQSLVGVQSARIGGRRPARGQQRAKAAVQSLGWTALGRPLPRGADDDGDDGTMVTDLAVLVDAIRDAAELLGLPAPRKPWLDPLPEQVTVAELAGVGASGSGTSGGSGRAWQDVVPVAYGLTDLPAQQARAPLAVDVVHGEHVLIVGGPRSGRSTALRTFAGSLARDASPQDVHLYGIDCGANALLPLVSLPHCGAVVTRDQPERLARLLDRLSAEVSRRQQLLAMRGASSAAEQRAMAATPEERLPWMVLLLDNWEGYTSTFEAYNYGKLIEGANRLFREGAAAGLKVVMTADRSGFNGQISSVFADKLILRMADPNDYTTGGLSAREVPKAMPSGRALRPTDRGVQESQIALLAPEPSGQAQVEALQRIARRAAEYYRQLPRRTRPMRVDALPPRITVAEAMALETDFTPPSPLWALLGVGGDELQPLGVDLQEAGPGFVIAGPQKSGRSTTLITAARSLLAGGVPVVLVTPRRSPLRELAAERGVLGVLGADASQDDLKELTAKAEGGPYVVVVDDGELIYDTPLDAALEAVVKSGLDGDHALIAAGNADQMGSQYRGFLVEARRSRNGLLLAPQGSTEGDLFNVRLPRDVGGGPTGRGLLVRGGELVQIQAVGPS
ncbi:FtsK/SpoIIIE domain-containing protein [Streptomyces cocklensis]|uniref:DNA segregation ATPase FtsK/SpoIIIE, S-DNA-T family n=1 Tax=Actinacidiphila cocklensis TaxID=887465 RepID=A0A9W4GQR5_9ACTN|nr:FtsK/SpoIIIE domain-containing protein [Actinacidiphila cocklensis]MDD1057492.1 FtsK/SpoIIIE domain-containing protein [Actinacidiphila cocklensis]CAG6393889.1 DNA segregation ATPase FtsK/SpoIIIE, S-DNA-T family [Actinacidiphila cocklensis]